MVSSAKHPKSGNEEQGEEKEEEEEEEEIKEPQQRKRICDFCGESKALLYCRADSAKLCFNCDREVHSTNPLFTKHSRSQLCDFCDSNPASIHCSTENLVLCQNCDWDSHGQASSSIHDRRPLEGFTGCPSAIELSTFLGFEDFGDKSIFSGRGGVGDGFLSESGIYGQRVSVDGFSDLLVWETPSIVSLDDLIVSSDSRQNFQAMGIPPLPKNRNTACGKHKEEILFQLRDMVMLETSLSIDHEEFESLLGFQPLVPEKNLQQGSIGTGFEHDAEPISLPICEESAIQWQGDCGEAANQTPFPSTLLGRSKESLLVPDKPDNVRGSGTYANGGQEKEPQHLIIGETLPFLPTVARPELTGQERETVISRYKEKKKTRRYDKQIRYESRKARADSRTRIKGRFAKMDPKP